MREVDTKTYVSMLRDIVNDGKDVSLLIAGSSMAPFLIHHRDTIVFGKPCRPLKKGDMAFFERANGQFVIHRIYRIKDGSYYMVGDGQTEIEGPINGSQIFAVVKKVCRKGKWLGPDDFLWKFFEKVWIRIIPCRPFVIKLLSLGRSI